MSAVKKGKVEWTGDNPFIYLKEDPNGEWSSLSLYFRIASSDYGTGHAILVMEDPYNNSVTDAKRYVITDNVPLAKYLIKNFVSYFALFRKSALDQLEYIDSAVFTTDNQFPKYVKESGTVKDRNLKIALLWNDLQDGIAVDVPVTETQTNAHEMLAVFYPATSAQVLVNDQALPGETIERDFQNQRAQSASLANSETWVQAEKQ